MSRQRVLKTAFRSPAAQMRHQHAGGPVMAGYFQRRASSERTQPFGKHFPVAGRYGLLAVGRLAGILSWGLVAFMAALMALRSGLS